MIKEKLVSNSDPQDDLELGDEDDGIGTGNDEDKWLHVFPKSVQVLKYIFLSPGHFRCVKYLYYSFSVILFLLGVLFPVFMDTGVVETEEHDPYGGASTAFMTFFYIQFIVYLYLPFYYYPLILELFSTKDIQLLLKEAISLSSFNSLQVKFRVVYFININVTTTSMFMYLYFADVEWATLIFSLVWFVFYIFPLSVVFGYLVCILEAHRIQAADFKDKLVILRIKYEASKESITSEFQGARNINTDMTVFRASNEVSSTSTFSQRHISTSSGSQTEFDEQIPLLASIEEITQQYLRLHDTFRLTSDKRGLFIFSTFFLLLMILLSSIWSIYEDFFSLKSTMGYIVMALFYVLEVGLMLATVNETGNLICRDISSFLLRVLVNTASAGQDNTNSTNSTAVNKITGFVSCLVHIKIEIPFFGNFALRSRTLIAIVASLLGAIIPGIIRNAM
jgi:hypothetical protein